MSYCPQSFNTEGNVSETIASNPRLSALNSDTPQQKLRSSSRKSNKKVVGFPIFPALSQPLPRLTKRGSHFPKLTVHSTQLQKILGLRM